VESGEVREVHHVACMVGYGAAAVNPYLLFESAEDLARRGEIELPLEEVQPRLLEALRTGLLKILSRRGISTIASYTGAQIFEAVGLDREFVRRHFGDTPNRIGGIGLRELAEEVLAHHASAFPGADGSRLPVGGRYRWAREGELHLWNPRTIPLLQHAVGLVSTGRCTRARRREDYRAFATDAEADIRRAAVRGQLRLREAAEPLPREQVEPAAEIVRRFATGAMSLGSLSPEAHETLAVAMNRIGGRSNTGEGGEDPRRYRRRPPRPLGDQTGRLRPVRRHLHLPGQRRRAPDQDRARLQARRGRPTARPQGHRVHRRPAVLHPGGGADLTAAAPRHLLHRGPQAADL
jgi:hypothetical protein